MASGENQNNIVQKSTALQLSPHDLKEVQTFTQYANKEEKKMKDLTSSVDGMGTIGLWWDSKVSDRNWRWYHLFSLQVSDKEGIKAEIKNYVEFYRKMIEAVSGMHSDDETEKEKVYALIVELYNNLSRLAEAAEEGEKTTTSSTVYELHKDILSKQEKLKNMMKRVECISLQQAWTRANDSLQRSLQVVEDLAARAQDSEAKYDDLCEKFDALLDQNKTLIKQQNFLLEENGKIMQQQQDLMEDNNQLKQQTDLLISIVATFAKEKEKEKKSPPPSKQN